MFEKLNETVSVSCTCVCGEKHQRRVPACASLARHPWADSDSLGKHYADKTIRCQKPVGHEGRHWNLYDMTNYAEWGDAAPVEAS